jgi:hypothetical protein
MRKLIISLASVALVGGFAATQLAAQDKKESKTVQGELVDMHCFSSKGLKGEKHAGCGTKCMSTGIPAGVLVDGKAWTLTTNPIPLAEHASKMIRVTGTQNADAQTIVPEKVEVQDAGNWTEVKLKDQHHS